MAQFLFILFSFFTVACALGVILNKNAVNSAMCLLLCLVGVAGLFAGLGAFLLAFLLLLVYAGAIVALFLFIVMLLDVRGAAQRARPRLWTVTAFAAFALLVAGLTTFVVRGRLVAPALSEAPAVGSSLKFYAYQLFTTYLLPVQVIGFLLLVAMIGAIVLSRPAAPEKPAGAGHPSP